MTTSKTKSIFWFYPFYALISPYFMTKIPCSRNTIETHTFSLQLIFMLGGTVSQYISSRIFKLKLNICSLNDARVAFIFEQKVVLYSV